MPQVVQPDNHDQFDVQQCLTCPVQ